MMPVMSLVRRTPELEPRLYKLDSILSVLKNTYLKMSMFLFLRVGYVRFWLSACILAVFGISSGYGFVNSALEPHSVQPNYKESTFVQKEGISELVNLFANDKKHKYIRHLEDNKGKVGVGYIRFLDLIAYMEVGESFLPYALRYPQRSHFDYHLLHQGNSSSFKRNWRKYRGSDRGLFGVTQVFLAEYVPQGNLQDPSVARDEKERATVSLHKLQRMTGLSIFASIPLIDMLAIDGFLMKHFPEVNKLSGKDVVAAFRNHSDDFYEAYHSPNKKLPSVKLQRIERYIETYLNNGKYFFNQAKA